MNNKFLGIMFLVQVLTLALICSSVNFSNWFPISALWISGILIGISIGEILQEHKHKCNKPKTAKNVARLSGLVNSEIIQ